MRNWIPTRNGMSVSDDADRASTFTFCSPLQWEHCACDAPPFMIQSCCLALVVHSIKVR